MHHVELKVWAGGEAESATPATICRDLQSAELQQPAAGCCHVARCKLGLAVVTIPGPTPQYIPAVAVVTCLVLLCSDCSGHTAPRRTTPGRALTLSPLTRTRVHIITGKYANESKTISVLHLNTTDDKDFNCFILFLDIPIFLMSE